MKYKAPELIALTPAINAIQSVQVSKSIDTEEDSDGEHSLTTSYSDWE